MITPLEAAKLIFDDYGGRLTVPPGQRLDIDHCQSALIQCGSTAVLVIRGTDEIGDWLRNIRLLPDFSLVSGDTCWWHGGFLTHARIAYGWARDKGVQAVIGHSLGAACVQVIAPSLGVPGLAFASPRPLFAPLSVSPRPPNADLVTNYQRADDWICDLPRAILGFENVGKSLVYSPVERHDGEDHRIAHYIEFLDQFV